MSQSLQILRWLSLGIWLWLPLLSYAGPAGDFAAANRAEQAKLLQLWSSAPDAARLPLLQALRQENMVIDEAGRPFIQQGGTLTPMEGAGAPQGEVKKIWLNNRLRILIANALSAQQLVSADAQIRLRAAMALQREAQS